MKHGGKREGAGKPALYGERMVRAEILIPQEAKNFFISLGEGNLSAGVRLAWRSLTQRAPDVCPSCAGEKKVIGEDGTIWVCGICGGTGKRR